MGSQTEDPTLGVLAPGERRRRIGQVGEAQIGEQRWPDPAVVAEQTGMLESGRKRLASGQAPSPLALLDHLDFPAFCGEHTGRNQAVVPSTNHHSAPQTDPPWSMA